VFLLRNLLPASCPHVLVEDLAMGIAVLEGARTRSPFNYMDQLISKKDIQRIFSISKSTAQRWVRTPGFPEAYALNSRVLRWERLDVEAWFLTKVSTPPVVRSVSKKVNGQIVIDGVVIRGVM